MNQDQIAGKWKEVKGQVRQKWGKLTDDDLAQIAGRREELVGRLQAAYGKTREVATREVDDFYKTL